jgi:hypothetical protein
MAESRAATDSICDLVEDDLRFPASFGEEANFCAGATQIHTHSPTCVKYAMSTGRGGCRFNAPWPRVERTTFTEEAGLQIRRNHTMVNRWNQAMAVGLRHNHDIAFVGTKARGLAIVYYLTNYATKVEDPVWKRAAAAKDLVEATEEGARSFLTRVANRVFTERPLSQVEVVAQMLGHPFEYTSHAHWVSVNVNGVYWRLFGHWPLLHEQASLEAGEDRLYLGKHGQKTTLLDAYPHRGPVLAELSVYEYASVVRLVNKRAKQERRGEVEFDRGWPPSEHLVQQLRRPGEHAMVCLDGYLATNFDEEEERYHRRFVETGKGMCPC